MPELGELRVWLEPRRCSGRGWQGHWPHRPGQGLDVHSQNSGKPMENSVQVLMGLMCILEGIMGTDRSGYEDNSLGGHIVGSDQATVDQSLGMKCEKKWKEYLDGRTLLEVKQRAG